MIGYMSSTKCLKTGHKLPETTCTVHTSLSKAQIPVLTYETPLATHPPFTPPSTKEKTHTHAHTSLSSCVIIKLFWTSHWKSNATCVSTRQMYCSCLLAPISSVIQPFLSPLPRFQTAPVTTNFTPEALRLPSCTDNIHTFEVSSLNQSILHHTQINRPNRVRLCRPVSTFKGGDN